jgi:hypothetical protein
MEAKLQLGGPMIATRPGKGHYSETEAAEALGLSVEKLRALVRRHIADSDEDLTNLSIAHLQPSDLLLLRILARQNATPVLVS